MWQVYDYMPGRDGNERFPKTRGATVYGPLPRKRWVPDGKPHKMNYKPRTRLANAPKADLHTPKTYTATKAVQYAAWLAARDGVVIPEDALGVPVWGEVIVPGKKRPEPRVKAVEWREPASPYFNHLRRLVDGEGKVIATTPIPHWDFVPAEPVEILLDS